DANYKDNFGQTRIKWNNDNNKLQRQIFYEIDDKLIKFLPKIKPIYIVKGIKGNLK
ncbi:19893_t:CDS:1, partial [Racocetra fulgida]